MAKVTTASKRDRINKRKRRRRQATAVIFILLALVGSVTLAVLAWNFVRNTFFDSAQEKEEYTSRIAPLVAIDTAPFADIASADDDTLLHAAILAALSQSDASSFERTDTGVLIPAVDVTRAGSAMYGSGYALLHRTINIGGVSYSYNSGSESYLVPDNRPLGVYYPVIEQITTSGNTKTLIVAYTRAMVVDPLNITDQREIGKYMEYVLIREGNSYYVYSVRESDYAPS